MNVLRHEQPVNCVAFAPDGTLLASATEDNEVWLWALGAGSVLTLVTHPSPVKTVAFSPNGMLIVSGADDGRARLWDVSNGRLVAVLDHGRSVSSVAVSPDGTLLLVAGTDPAIGIWRLADTSLVQPITQRLQQKYQRPQPWRERYPPTAEDAVFAPGGQIGAATDANAVYIWSLSEGEVLRTLKSGLYSISDICFSPDGTLLATAQGEMLPRVWRVDDGADLGLFRYADNTDISALSVAFSPNGALLASGATDGVLQVWRVADHEPVQSLAGHTSDVWSVAFSPKGHLLASGSLDGTVRLWELDQYELQETRDQS